MQDGSLQIRPDTKIGELLDAYPQLEEVLITLAPAFKKLKNPILRKTVARVTSIRQAARVGGKPVGDMVNALRQAAGQSQLEVDDGHSSTGPDGAGSGDEWSHPDKIYKSFDACQMIESGEQPLGKVMADLRQLPPGAVYELITPFEPAPLMDQAKAQGFKVITRKDEDELFKTYFKHVDA